MLSAAVCDDEAEVCGELARLIKKYLPDCETDCFVSGEALLRETKKYDLIFLDIKMRGISGMRTAEKLRESGCRSMMIFISGAREYVFSAFDVGAFHYLLKPVSEEKLRRVLERAVSEMSEKRDDRRILVKTKDRSVCVSADDILYLENLMRKIAVHTHTGTLSFYGTMSEMQEQLGDGFFRSHRGYLVNLAYVAEYSSSEITLTNGERVLIAKGKYPEFISSYHCFLRGKGAPDA